MSPLYGGATPLPCWCRDLVPGRKVLCNMVIILHHNLGWLSIKLISQLEWCECCCNILRVSFFRATSVPCLHCLWNQDLFVHSTPVVPLATMHPGEPMSFRFYLSGQIMLLLWIQWVPFISLISQTSSIDTNVHDWYESHRKLATCVHVISH